MQVHLVGPITVERKYIDVKLLIISKINKEARNRTK